MLFKKAGLALGTAAVTLSLLATPIFALEYQLAKEAEIAGIYGIELRWLNVSSVTPNIELKWPIFGHKNRPRKLGG